jgi:HK97 family phage major capsid protein
VARALSEIRNDLTAARNRRDDIQDDLEATFTGEEPDSGLLKRRDNLAAGLSKVKHEVEGLEDEIREALAEGLRNGSLSTAPGEASYDRSGASTNDGSDPRSRRDRDMGLRAIERHKDVLSAEAGDRLDKLVRRDRFGLEARYLDAVGNPNYESAFGKLLAHPTDAHLRFSREETSAVQAVAESVSERGMTEGTGSAGGFGIPISIDPTILLASNGVLNPVREIARTITVSTRETRLVSSVGAAASFDAEAAEVSDDTIALVQPTITAQMARMFIPFSYELGDDYRSLVAELGRVITDEKDKLESTMFLSGNGTNQPVGLLAIGTTGSLTTTQRVQTDITNVLDIDDWWDLRGTFGALRWAPAGTILANPKTFDNAFRFTPAGSTTEPQAMPTREGPFMGLPKREWSEMATATTTTVKVGLVGDFDNYVIADRIGLEVEVIPTLFGATNHFPTGQKGVFARWRVGTVVAVPNAFRYLEIL